MNINNIKRYTCLGLCVLCTTQMLHAESILHAGENVTVLKIDGQKIESGFFSAPKTRFKLPAGNHTVTARYERLFDISSDEHDILRSVALTVPVRMQDGKKYQLVMADQPTSYANAKVYVEKPNMQILQGGKVVSSKVAITGDSGGILAGIGGLFSGGSTKNYEVINTTSNTAVNTTSQSSGSNGKPVLDQFMRIWLEASPEERKKIKSWVKDQ